MELILGKLIGKGSDGDVYELGKEKIIKFVQPGINGFSNYLEAFIMLYLKNDNIMQADKIEIGKDHLIKFVQERARGDLSYYIKNKIIKKNEKKEIINKIILGVSYLHSYGIIHGDLKPSNILIFDNGNIKLSDFSMARLITTDQKIFQTLYTLLYRPKEISRGEISLKSDIYALGCIIYEIYYGKKFYNCINKELYHVKCSEENLEENKKLNDFILKMLSDDINQRPTIKEVLNFFNIKKKLS